MGYNDIRPCSGTIKFQTAQTRREEKNYKENKKMKYGVSVFFEINNVQKNKKQELSCKHGIGS